MPVSHNTRIAMRIAAEIMESPMLSIPAIRMATDWSSRPFLRMRSPYPSFITMETQVRMMTNVL